MSAVDMILGRLDKPRQTGRDRWRSRCPSCGGGSTSSLSVGVGADGAVLLKCFKGCEVAQVVDALGLQLSDLFPPKLEAGQGAAPMKRRRLISDRQALDLLHDEAQLVAIVGLNLARGVPVVDADLERVLQAAGRVAYLRNEVMA